MSLVKYKDIVIAADERLKKEVKNYLLSVYQTNPNSIKNLVVNFNFLDSSTVQNQSVDITVDLDNLDYSEL